LRRVRLSTQIGNSALTDVSLPIFPEVREPVAGGTIRERCDGAQERNRDLLVYLIYSMKKISRFVLVMLAASAIVDVIGFAFGLFYAGLFYDNLAHFLTTFSLVALAGELYFRRGLVSQRVPRLTTRRALAAGAALGFAGGVAWEDFEILLDLAFPGLIYNPPVDSVVDTLFGTLGGALGLWRSAAHFGLISRKRLS
jgi:predicted Abi (CAAX) family protease